MIGEEIIDRVGRKGEGGEYKGNVWWETALPKRGWHMFRYNNNKGLLDSLGLSCIPYLTLPLPTSLAELSMWGTSQTFALTLLQWPAK